MTRDEVVMAFWVYESVRNLNWMKAMKVPACIIRAWSTFTIAVIGLFVLTRQQSFRT